MAYKAKQAHYFFKVDSPDSVSIAKFTPDGEFIQTYHLMRVQLHGREDWVCDCPAAHRYSDREDKHVAWWKRLQDIFQRHPELITNQVVYYDSKDDHFYPGQSFETTVPLEEAN